MPHVSKQSLIGAIALYTAGGLFWSFLPFFIGLQEEMSSLSATRAGSLGSTYLVGFTLVSLCGPWWMERWRWHGWIGLACLCIWLGLGAMSATTRYGLLLGACLAVGAGMGMFWVLAFRVFGASERPQRAFGLAVTLGYGLLALVTYGIGHLILPNAGLGGITLAIGTLVGVLAALSSGLSWSRTGEITRHVPASVASQVSARSAWPVMLALLGVVLLSLSFASIWAFAERIGNQAGFSHAQVAAVLSCNLLVTGAGSLLAAGVGNRCPRWVLLVGLGLMLVLCDVAVAGVSRFSVYILAISGMGLAVGIGMPVQLGIVAWLDRAKRYVPLVAAAQGLGTAIGPGLGGAAFDWGGVPALVTLAAASAAASVLLLLGLLALNRNQGAE